MNYKRIYSEIILNRVNNPLPADVYGQKHHVLPRSLYPQYKNTKANLVKLSYREHYICHWLLTKIKPNSIEMKRAFWMMNLQHNDRYINSRAFEQLKKKTYSFCITCGALGHVHSPEQRMKISENTKSAMKRLEIKKKMSDCSKDFWTRPEYRQKQLKIMKERWADINFRKKYQKPLICIETGIIYNSLHQAYSITGISNISQACSGKRKHAGGYHWKYIDEVKNEEE